MRILIVEDEPEIRRFVRMTLESEAHEVNEAATLQRGRCAEAAKADDQGKRLSEPVLLRSYRTLFNRTATVTLPVRSTRNSDPARLRAFIYSEVSENWEPLFPPAGSEGLRFDAAKRTVSFEIQVLGVFLVLETHPDWTPRSAVKNPPVRAAAA